VIDVIVENDPLTIGPALKLIYPRTPMVHRNQLGRDLVEPEIAEVFVPVFERDLGRSIR